MEPCSDAAPLRSISARKALVGGAERSGGADNRCRSSARQFVSDFPLRRLKPLARLTLRRPHVERHLPLDSLLQLIGEPDRYVGMPEYRLPILLSAGLGDEMTPFDEN